MDKLADLLHVTGTVCTAQETAAWFQYPLHFPADLRDILAVEEYMIGNHEIQAVILKGEIVAVKGIKRKA